MKKTIGQKCKSWSTTILVFGILAGIATYMVGIVTATQIDSLIPMLAGLLFGTSVLVGAIGASTVIECIADTNCKTSYLYECKLLEIQASYTSQSAKPSWKCFCGNTVSGDLEECPVCGRSKILNT